MAFLRQAASVLLLSSSMVQEVVAQEAQPSRKEVMCAEYQQSAGITSWKYTLPVYWECDYPSCAGRQQTPIDIHEEYAMAPPAGEYSRRLEMMEAMTVYSFMQSETFDGFVQNTGHGLQVTHDLGTFTYPTGELYNGLQFHIHFPSEHALEGELKACELHVVHQKAGASGTDGLLVVGVLFGIGARNDLIHKMGLPGNAPVESGTLVIPDVNIKRDFATVLQKHFYHYVGSLTTPPCSETVRWFILKDILTVDQAQVDSFHALYGMGPPANNRPLQPYNARQLYMDTVSGCYTEGRRYGHDWDYVLPGCWPALGYSQCAGLQQSPMNIDTGSITGVGMGDESLSTATEYEEVTGAATHNTGHGLQINAPEGSFGIFAYDGHIYKALQLHTHVPSEHTIDGQLHACELHIVHQKDGSTGTDNLLVIGIMFRKDTTPSSFLQNMGLHQGNGARVQNTGAPEDESGEEKYPFPGTLDLGVEFDAQLAGDYYRYDGSLTTPPCSQTVKWFVTTVALTISRAQLDKHHSIFKKPALDRHPQLRNGRTLVKNKMDPGFQPVQAEQFGCTGESYTQSVSVRRLSPDSWDYLHADCWKVTYSDCGGRQQSPVDVNHLGPFVDEATEAMNLLALSRYVEVDDCRIRNTGHGLQTESTSGATFGTLEMDGLTYNALQYHIHCPSEHTIDGAFYTCEVHAVHQASDATGLDGLLVFGVLYKIGALSDIFIEHFVRAADVEETDIDEKISLRDYHHLRDGFYRYDGSLTTPPCSETVKWFVLIKMSTLTQAHADILLDAMQYPNLNNRPIQPLHGRGIWKNSLPGCYFPSNPDPTSRRLAAEPWDYLMPQCWSPDYPNCAGRSQSPIDILKQFIEHTGTDVITLAHESVTNAVSQQTAHGLQVEYTVGHVIFGGDTYKTLQFHLHMPSEHAVDGELTYAELHTVHQLERATGLESLLVIGVMYDLGKESVFLSKVFPVLDGRSETTIPSIALDEEELFSASALGFYAYSGSLTTPPCDETVQWVVFKKRHTVDQQQVDRFHVLFPKPQNNRPLQPYFGRFVVEDDDGKDDEEPTVFDNCFPYEADIVAEGIGNMPIAQAKTTHRVLVQMPSGEVALQPVLGFIHDLAIDSPSQVGLVSAEHGHGVLRATPMHLVFKMVDGISVSCTMADLKVGDRFVTASSSSLELEEGTLIFAIRTDVTRSGARSPFLAAGTVVVDGLPVSLYAGVSGRALPHCAQHSWFYFLRALAYLRPSVALLSESRTPRQLLTGVLQQSTHH
eukprot:TRINITY_DN11180_c0_g1_i1.p1 TRINITY_DN11180_c0_g1~~TRINITY_DN11180_c0_g1_i1.p1  ORF type:complete len:1294 (+),score=165.93 TRINITY_DN11180_c0_g1_i1:88-3882(+)